MSWVKKGSDAERKGLAVGDRVLAWNKFEPTRANLWQINYVYRHIRPQQLQRVIVRKPDGAEKVLDIASEVRERPAGNLEDLIRDTEDAYSTPFHYQKALGDTLVVAMSSFGEPSEVAGFMKKARGYKNLVLDLRGNGGGYVVAIEMLASWAFDREIRIGTMKTRKEEKPEIAKGRKDAFQGRIVVLIDSQSASAAEVTARIMQIEKRGTVIGDRSAGAVMTSRFFSHTLGQDFRARQPRFLRDEHHGCRLEDVGWIQPGEGRRDPRRGSPPDGRGSRVRARSRAGARHHAARRHDDRRAGRHVLSAAVTHGRYEARQRRTPTARTAPAATYGSARATSDSAAFV